MAPTNSPRRRYADQRPVDHHAQGGAFDVVVAGGDDAAESTVRTAIIVLLLAAPVVVAVAAGATYRLVRRSLRSVDAMRARVAAISSADLAERVPVPPGRDEISALAVTMNHMLDRIEPAMWRSVSLSVMPLMSCGAR